MMGQQDRCEALFYYFRVEDQVPENHLLRLIEKHISFAFVREKLKESYTIWAGPRLIPSFSAHSADRLFVRITSERTLVEETAHAPGVALV
jgi:transposase